MNVSTLGAFKQRHAERSDRFTMVTLDSFTIASIGVRAPLDLGAGGGGGGSGDLIARKNYTMPESMCCTSALKSQQKQKRSQCLRLMNVLSVQNYS